MLAGHPSWRLTCHACHTCIFPSQLFQLPIAAERRAGIVQERSSSDYASPERRWQGGKKSKRRALSIRERVSLGHANLKESFSRCA